MQVAESFLVGADEEDAHHVGLAIAQRVERDGGFLAGVVHEAVEHAFAVAGDVGDDSLAIRFLIEAVDRRDGEELVDGPDVRQALEHGEVPVVEIGEPGF